jgi:hypothetical protein
MKYPLLFAVTLLLASCDKVEDPLGVDDASPPPPPSGVARRILLEEYTGHECTYCPEGHVIAQGLHDQYGDELVIIAMQSTACTILIFEHRMAMPFFSGGIRFPYPKR